MKNRARNFSSKSSHKLWGIHSLWEMVSPLHVSLNRQGLQPPIISWQRSQWCLLYKGWTVPSPHRLSLVMVEVHEILTNTVQWLFCDWGGGRASFFGVSNLPCIRVTQLLWVMECCIHKVPDFEALDSGIYCVDGLFHSTSSFPSLWNVNPVKKTCLIFDVHYI